MYCVDEWTGSGNSAISRGERIAQVLQPSKVDFQQSMAMQQELIDWRYQSHIFLADFLGLCKGIYRYTLKIWPDIWYSTFILGSWNSH